MKDKNTALDTNDKPVQKPKKASYTSPELKVYGTVTKLTKGSQSAGSDGGSATMFNPSEPANKENIVKIGVHPYGIGLYLFDYKPEYREQWGYGRQFGVMADEVEAVMPDAVCVHPNGYKMVNYAMLGIHRTLH